MAELGFAHNSLPSADPYLQTGSQVWSTALFGVLQMIWISYYYLYIREQIECDWEVGTHFGLGMGALVFRSSLSPLHSFAFPAWPWREARADLYSQPFLYITLSSVLFHLIMLLWWFCSQMNLPEIRCLSELRCNLLQAFLPHCFLVFFTTCKMHRSTQSPK